MLKKVLTNTAFQILGKIVTASSTFLLTVIIGRSLGPAGYGEFTKIFVFVGYFYTLYDFGLNNTFIKLTTAKEGSKKQIFSTLLGLRLVISTTLAITATLIAFALPYDLDKSTGFGPIVKTGVAIASLTIITQALTTTANALFQRNLRYNLALLATALGSATVVIASLGVLLHGKNLLEFVGAYIVGGFFFALASLFLVARKLHITPTPVFNITGFRSLLSVSWPIGLALILNLVYFRADVLILSYFRPPGEIGFYGLSYQFFEAALTIPLFFANSLFPLLSSLFVKSRDAYQKEVKFYFGVLVLTSLVVVFALFVISHFIPIFYGQNFTPAIKSLRILALGMPFFFASALLWHVMIIANKQKLLPVIYGAGALVNIVANLIFIPIYGYLAAATITVVSEALVVALLIFTARSSGSLS